MWVQEDISARRLARFIGREMTVLVDDIDEEGVVVARSPGDAPEIDGLVFVVAGDAEVEAQVGDFLRVRITDSDTHDLYAEVVAETN
jgi:ribosomal protein S12 methylthiotransferase